MREIKFRVWDGFRYIYFDNHRYDLIYNDISGWNVCPNIPNYKGKWITGESSDTAESFKLEQYTGLKDRNGKEVYEGDIESSGGVIKLGIYEMFSDRSGVPTWVSEKKNGASFVIMCDNEFKIRETIIGNIHESHKLLNKLKEEKP